MFKRRDKRPLWEILWRVIYPRGGWGRAAGYMRHRLTRLPDTPERIARGIGAGVFASFTPFFGMHFLVAALVGKLVRANILASLLGTFFGNPLTFVPIAASSLTTGAFLLGRDETPINPGRLGRQFAGAWLDLWHNFLSLFSDHDADWHGLSLFFHDIFFPFMVGGIFPGTLAAVVCYYLSVPIIRVYQSRRQAARERRREQRGRSAADLRGQS